VLAIASAFDLLTTCAAERPLAWPEALAQLAKTRGEAFDPWLVDLLAEEVRKEPPAENDREVMIVPAGAMPWRSIANEPADDDDRVDDELEVMLDEHRREDGA
jgi:hypothetical protein